MAYGPFAHSTAITVRSRMLKVISSPKTFVRLHSTRIDCPGSLYIVGVCQLATNSGVGVDCPTHNHRPPLSSHSQNSLSCLTLHGRLPSLLPRNFILQTLGPFLDPFLRPFGSPVNKNDVLRMRSPSTTIKSTPTERADIASHPDVSSSIGAPSPRRFPSVPSS